MTQRTPLHATHVAAGARMVDFAGWDMPVNYGSQIEEHHAVRNDCGMFDVSHMCAVDVVPQQIRCGRIRMRYEIEIESWFPERSAVETLERTKGFFSFRRMKLTAFSVMRRVKRLWSGSLISTFSLS